MENKEKNNENLSMEETVERPKPVLLTKVQRQLKKKLKNQLMAFMKNLNL
jgi:hypothetical protein